MSPGPPSSEQVLSNQNAVIAANNAGVQCLAATTIAAVAYQAGFRGRDLVMAVQISMAEDTSGDPRAVNVNKDGSRDRGLWQINSKAHPNYSDDFCFNPGTCAQAAYAISGSGHTWTPWSTFNNGAYKKFQSDAEKACGTVNTTGDTSGAANTTAAGAAGAVYRNSPRLPQLTLQAVPADLHTPDQILVRGTALGELLGQFTASGSISMSMTEMPVITLVLTDPDFHILNASWMDLGCPVTWGPDWRLEVCAIDSQPVNGMHQLTLTLWPRGAATLRQNQGATLESVTPGEYIENQCAPIGVGVLNYEGRALVGSVGPATSTTGEQESMWDTFSRLASENGDDLFMDFNGNIVYGKPTEMVLTRERFDVGYKLSLGDERYDVFEMPTAHLAIDKTNSLPTDREFDFSLPRWRAERIRPGMRCVANLGVAGSGLSKYNDDNRIVQTISWAIDPNDPVHIVAVLPTDPVPSGNGDGTSTGAIGTSTGGGLNKGSKNASDMVAFAQSMTGKPYKEDTSINYLTNANPIDFDCSSLVQWSSAQVGVTVPRTSGQQYAASEHITIDQALQTRGALLFSGDGGSQHVAISLGDGHSTIQARKPGTQVGVVTSITGFNFTLAGLIKGMDYGASQTPASTFGGTVDAATAQAQANSPGLSAGQWADLPNGQQAWVKNP